MSILKLSDKQILELKKDLFAVNTQLSKEHTDEQGHKYIWPMNEQLKMYLNTYMAVYAKKLDRLTNVLTALTFVLILIGISNIIN